MVQLVTFYMTSSPPRLAPCRVRCSDPLICSINIISITEEYFYIIIMAWCVLYISKLTVVMVMMLMQ